MTIIKNYNYSDREIKTSIIDTYGGEFIWIAYEQDSDGNCKIEKVSAHDPSKVYYSFDIEVDEIVKFYINGTTLYVAFNDTTYIGAKYSLTNPLTTYTYFSLPGSVTQNVVDLITDGSSIYYLLPGDDSGTNSEIIITNTSGTYSDTIDLTTVNYARSFCFDSNDEIQVITFTSPVNLVRVYDLSTTPQFSITAITD